MQEHCASLPTSPDICTLVQMAVPDSLSVLLTATEMLTVQLAGNGEMLSPLHRHVPGSGDQMMCLSQSVDWRNEQITANLFEI